MFWGGHRARPANALMLAFGFALPYHILRTATAAGLRVHVLGSGPSRGLRTSRFCASYTRSESSGNDEADRRIVADEINRIARQRRLDIVFPSDDVSTRLLASLRDELPVRSSPLPDLATFDLLNDKGNFTRFALDHRVRVPQGWTYGEVEELRRDIRSGKLCLPLTVKPTNRSGGYGVIHIRAEREMPELDKVEYRPVMAQRHIVGETIGISVICRNGEILAHATQRRGERRFQLFADPDLFDNVRRLVAAAGLNGPANLDAVIEASSGRSYIVECNPRFWFTIFMSMLVGINFVDFAFAERASEGPQPATLDRAELGLSLKETLVRPWKARRAEWKLLAYHLGDPLAYLALRHELFDDREVAVPAARMQAYRPSIAAGRFEPLLSDG
jgi:hypothetical protein